MLVWEDDVRPSSMKAPAGPALQPQAPTRDVSPSLQSAVPAMPAWPKDKETPKWDVNQPPGELKRIRYTVSESTWTNLDVSPDGQRIAFDLLGDLYELPIAGGQAKHVGHLKPR